MTVLSESQEQYAYHILNTTEILDALGFNLHPQKYKLVPTQTIQYLGFILNSLHMSVTLTKTKIRTHKIKQTKPSVPFGRFNSKNGGCSARGSLGITFSINQWRLKRMRH